MTMRTEWNITLPCAYIGHEGQLRVNSVSRLELKKSFRIITICNQEEAEARIQTFRVPGDSKISSA